MTTFGYPYLQELIYFFLGRINGPNIVWVKNESCMRGISPLVDVHRKGSTAKPPANPILSLVCPVWFVWKSNGWDHRCIYIHCWGVSGFQWPLGCFDVFPRRKTQLQNVPCAFTPKKRGVIFRPMSHRFHWIRTCLPSMRSICVTCVCWVMCRCLP